MIALIPCGSIPLKPILQSLPRRASPTPSYRVPPRAIYRMRDEKTAHRTALWIAFPRTISNCIRNKSLRAEQATFFVNHTVQIAILRGLRNSTATSAKEIMLYHPALIGSDRSQNEKFDLTRRIRTSYGTRCKWRYGENLRWIDTGYGVRSFIFRWYGWYGKLILSPHLSPWRRIHQANNFLPAHFYILNAL